MLKDRFAGKQLNVK